MRTKWIVSGLAIAIAAGVGFARVRASRGAQVALVTAGEVSERIVARATVVPREGIAEVRPRVDGRVLRVEVREGDAVQAGQTLATIEADSLTDEVARREAEEQAVAASAESIAHGLRPEERAALEAEARGAEEELALARGRAGRTQKLADNGAIPEATNEESGHALEIARARVEVTRARLRLGRAGGRAEEVKGARARVAAAEASLKQAQRQLERTRLVAPIAGVVLARRVDPGDTIDVADGAVLPALFEIADAQDIEARVEVEEGDATRVAAGLVATFASSTGEVVAHGTITRVSARCDRRAIGGDPATVRGDGLVRAAWVALEGARATSLPIGARLEATIELPARRVAALVPRSAVHVRDGVARLEVAGGGFAQERVVSLGAADGSFVEVRGVAAGERVVLR